MDPHIPPVEQQVFLKVVPVQHMNLHNAPHSDMSLNFSTQTLGEYYTHIKNQIDAWLEPSVVSSVCTCCSPPISKKFQVGNVMLGVKRFMSGKHFVAEIGFFNTSGRYKGQCVWLSVVEAHNVLILFNEILTHVATAAAVLNWDFFSKSVDRKQLSDYYVGDVIQYVPVDFVRLGIGRFDQLPYVLQDTNYVPALSSSRIPVAYETAGNITDQVKTELDPALLWFRSQRYDILKIPHTYVAPNPLPSDQLEDELRRYQPGHYEPFTPLELDRLQ
jgi:hypothetical protein